MEEKPKKEPFDFNYEAVGEINVVLTGDNVPSYPGLLRIAGDLQQYAARWESLAQMPTFLSYWSMTFTGAKVDARWKIGGNPFSEDRDQSPEFRSAYRQTLRELQERKENAGHVKAVEQAKADGRKFVRYLLDRAHASAPDIVGSMQALYYSLILLGYASYEAFVGDLLEEALNIDVVLANSYINKLKRRERHLLVHDVENPQWGTVLRASPKRMPLNKLRDIKECYYRAYGQDSGALFRGKNLATMEQLRHLVAHRAGVVDRSFLQQVKNDKRFSDAEIGKPLDIDGAVLNELYLSCLQSAADALKFVSDRLPVPDHVD